MFKLTDYIPKDKLEEFCQTHHIKKFALFGSVLHDELRPDSDIYKLIINSSFQPTLKSTPPLLIAGYPKRCYPKKENHE